MAACNLMYKTGTKTKTTRRPSIDGLSPTKAP